MTDTRSAASTPPLIVSPLGSAAQARLEEYVAGVGLLLGDMRRRESFALYAAGLLGEGERKPRPRFADRKSVAVVLGDGGG